jgi:hypothetical protein
MSLVEEGTPNPHGEALVDELAWVHGIIRDNLAAIADMVARIEGGDPAAQVHAQIQTFAAHSVVWTLRINCLRYCSLVHGHHHGEDSHFFPGLRRLNPDLCPVIDKLEADHVAISGYLDAVEAAAERLLTDEAARPALAEALGALGTHLLTHLAYEEAQLNPTLRRMTGWPWR